MNNIIKVFFILSIFLLFQSCKNYEKEKLITDYKAKEINFTDYSFTINYQDEIYNRTILFEAILGDIYKENGKIYFYLYNEAGYFKLARSSSITDNNSEINRYNDNFKRDDEIKVVAKITDFNFYQLKEEGYDENGPWFSPSVGCEGELYKIIKK
jgi:hypothetical protein